MKRCSKCGEDKRDEAFADSSAAIDGLQAWCRDCKSRQPVSPPARSFTPVFEKLCPKCGDTKSGLDFALKREGDLSYGLQAWCKVCMKLYKRDRRARKSVAQMVFERREREAIKQFRYQAMIPKPPTP